jgi:hypothetical protein
LNVLKRQKYFSNQFSPISETALLFERFPGFARSLFWEEQRAGEDEYEAMVE